MKELIVISNLADTATDVKDDLTKDEYIKYLEQRITQISKVAFTATRLLKQSQYSTKKEIENALNGLQTIFAELSELELKDYLTKEFNDVKMLQLASEDPPLYEAINSLIEETKQRIGEQQ